MDDFVPATVVGYSEWPKNTPNYWALPAMGDVVGWTYRKDWFEKPELQAEFKEEVRPRSRRRRRPGRAQADRRVLPGQGDRRQEGLRRLDLHRARLGRHHHGRDMDVLYSFGFKYENPDKPYEMEGFVNSDGRGEGARVLQGALQVLHAARPHQRLHGRRPRRVQVRPGGDA